MRAIFGAAAFAVLASGCFGQNILIQNARLIDGTGAPSRTASVRIKGGKIERISATRLKARSGEEVRDAAGLVLAPGFIDLHNHSDRGLDAEPAAVTQVAQGITTAVVGMDGGSAFPIGAWVEKRRTNPPAINTMIFAGHATIRTKVMGADYKRRATEQEVRRMQVLLEEAMRDGARGLSSGLEYEVGGYASTEEMIALARVAARFKGIYVSHIRDEADKSFQAISEVIRIAEEAEIPAHISHIKLGTVNVWGKARDAIRMIEDARRRGLNITADCYPYDAWASTITVLIPNKEYEDPVSVKRGLDDVGGGANVTIVSCREHPDYEFFNLDQIAAKKGVTAVDVFIDVVRSGGASVVCRSMTEPDIRAFYTASWIAVASDGGIGMRHPRAAGSFPKVLGKYVREERWMSLEAAIYKMTAYPASILGLKDRGVIREGLRADLVLFNPDTIRDRSTFSKPGELATGVETVWVAGVPVWPAGQTTGKLPGTVLVWR